MKIDFLGCSGGVDGGHACSTCYRINDTLLVDCGTGAGNMTMAEMERIEHVLLTHAHLDHIACLPLMIDTIAGHRPEPTLAWGLPGVIKIIKDHVLNDLVWPDFTVIPTPKNPFLVLKTLPEEPLNVEGLQVHVLDAAHGIPACGYLFRKGEVSVAFSGDTGPDDAFWNAIKDIPDLHAVAIECSYPNRERELANISKHMHVDAVVKHSACLPEHVALIIVHRKPGREEQIAKELKALIPNRRIELPLSGDSLTIPLPAIQSK
jgi:3',5'-cyclic-nucleotide phosphodiesterase